MNRVTHLGLIVLLSTFLLLAVSACGGGDEEPQAEASPAATEPAADEAAEAAPTEEEAAAEEEAEAEATVEPAEEESTEAESAEEAAEDEGEDAGEEVATMEEPPISVSFLQPTDNAIIPVTSTVIMTATGVTIAPAGEVAEGQVHMHILIDVPFVEAGTPIPNDEQHRHFGDASTTAELGLAPGSHTLRLQAADGAHVALEGDEYRDEIVVSVTEGAAEQAVRFAIPTDGATVPPTFDVVMAATGLIVEPSGPINAGAGHMHILVDTDFIEPGNPIPNDDNHLHFGGAQLNTTLELEPGDHLLRLQMADGAHVALEGEQYRDEITVTVAEDAPAAQIYFIAPEDGATVTSPVAIQMGATGLFVERSGGVLREGAGHMHILINTDFLAPGEVIPTDDTHVHFGGGQLETTLELEPGEYVLRLQMANGAHLALEGDQYRDEITVTVSE